MGRALNVIYLTCREVSDIVSHHIIGSKLRKYGQNEIIIKLHDWLDYHVQRIIIKGLESNHEEVSSGLPWYQMDPVLFMEDRIVTTLSFF